jgi:hypothetical protein
MIRDMMPNFELDFSALALILLLALAKPRRCRAVSRCQFSINSWQFWFTAEPRYITPIDLISLIYHAARDHHSSLKRKAQPLLSQPANPFSTFTLRGNKR